VSPARISQDGRWWWDGRAWRSRLVEGHLDLFWFTTTPDWLQRVAITGLIGLIPIVGSINLMGWTLVATDMIRGGWRELPPAGFQYLERGVAPFLVSLVYGLVAALMVGSQIVAAVALLLAKPADVLTAIVLIFLAVFLLIAWWLISLYLLAAILIGSDKLGIGKALDPRRLFALAQKNSDASVHVALIYGLGSIALSAASVALSFVPFGGFLALIALPGVYAMAVPRLATFQVETESRALALTR
jgi:hypothetical protein